MTADHRHDDHAALSARLDAHEAQLARLRRRGRRSTRLSALAVVALLVALLPLSLLAANPFTDLTGGPHDANIDAIFDAGITTGCEPGVRYCPTATVTREEMASFLARTAGLGGNAPVANAKTAQTAGNALTATTARRLATDPAGETNYAANDLIRVALRANGDTTVLTDTYQPYGAPLTIVAPVKGFVQVTATLEVRVSAGAGCPCEIDAQLKNQLGITGGRSEQTVPATNNYRATVPLVWVFAAEPGVQTIAIEADRASGSGAVQAYYSRATALFVPFGGGGAVALDTGNAPTEEKP